MHKKILKYSFASLLGLSAFFQPVLAQTIPRGNDWNVTFTKNEKMESNFTTGSIDDTIYQMQPGDEAILQIKLDNKNNKSTEWYMSHKILSSLEDSANVAQGGAYTYKLTYTGVNGRVQTLFDSESVGGEDRTQNNEGLHGVDQSMEQWFYLDTLQKSQEGMIELRVSLDGETQGNDYQSTLADLQMQFAVEEGSNRPNTSTGESTRPVNTSIKTNQTPWTLLSFLSGIVLLLLALIGIKARKENR